MKKFSFRLQPILRLREHYERMAEIDVAKAVFDLTNCEKRIKAAKNDLDIANKELAIEVASGISVERYHRFTAYMDGIDAFIESESTLREKLKKILEQKKETLKEKSIERKVMANLKTRRKDAYYNELEKSMQKEIDDTIIVRKAREINL